MCIHIYKLENYNLSSWIYFKEIRPKICINYFHNFGILVPTMDYDKNKGSGIDFGSIFLLCLTVPVIRSIFFWHGSSPWIRVHNLLHNRNECVRHCDVAIFLQNMFESVFA